MDFSKDYDSFEAINEGIESLENLHQLIDTRQAAGYERHERLTN